MITLSEKEKQAILDVEAALIKLEKEYPAVYKHFFLANLEEIVNERAQRSG